MSKTKYIVPLLAFSFLGAELVVAHSEKSKSPRVEVTTPQGAKILGYTIERIQIHNKPLVQALDELAERLRVPYSLESRPASGSEHWLATNVSLDLKHATVSSILMALHRQAPALEWREANGVLNIVQSDLLTDATWPVNRVVDSVNVRTDRHDLPRFLTKFWQEIEPPPQVQYLDSDFRWFTDAQGEVSARLISSHIDLRLQNTNLRDVLNAFVSDPAQRGGRLIWEVRCDEGKDKIKLDVYPR